MNNKHYVWFKQHQIKRHLYILLHMRATKPHTCDPMEAFFNVEN